jgi:Domain of unknown function (DUF4224)
VSLHLTEDELFEVTGYRHKKKVAHALALMEVQFKVRPADGMVLVLRDHYSQVMMPASAKKARREPNWEAARGNDGPTTHAKPAPSEVHHRPPRGVLVRPDWSQGRPRGARG